jgi:predicted RNA-binding Zn-ribbon protein involved in translation (DUF1610 family)
MEYDETQELIKLMVEKHYNLGNVTPIYSEDLLDLGLNNITNWDQDVVNEGLNIPKPETCPVCGSKNTRPDYDSPMTMKNCNTCGSEWVSQNGVQDVTFNAREFQNDYDNKTEEIWNDYTEEHECPECGSPYITSLGYNYDTGYIDYECDDCEYQGIKSEFQRHKQNEQNHMKTGKLKLVEVLTASDIAQIKSLAAIEANKVRADLKPEIKGAKDKAIAIEKDLAKHSQDKTSHLKNQDVKDVIKPEIEKMKDQQNKIDDNISKVEKTINDKIDKVTNSKELEQKMKEMIADVMVKYHQTLWIKRGFWTNGLTK